eukprot:1155800-Pelagomonas_calceolata.AAC.3
MNDYWLRVCIWLQYTLTKCLISSAHALLSGLHRDSPLLRCHLDALGLSSSGFGLLGPASRSEPPIWSFSVHSLMKHPEQACTHELQRFPEGVHKEAQNVTRVHIVVRQTGTA